MRRWDQERGMRESNEMEWNEEDEQFHSKDLATTNVA